MLLCCKKLESRILGHMAGYGRALGARYCTRPLCRLVCVLYFVAVFGLTGGFVVFSRNTPHDARMKLSVTFLQEIRG